MGALKRKLKRTKKFPRLLYYFLIIVYLITLIYLGICVVSLNDIETILRYIGLVLLVLFFIFFLYKGICLLLEKRYGKFYLLSLITLIIVLLMGGGSYVISNLYGGISNLTESNRVLYTSYLISLKDTEITKDSVLGMINSDDDIEGYVLAKKIIKNKKLKNDVESYFSYIDMLDDLYNHKVDGIFVSSNYKTLFGSEEGFESIGTDTKIVYKYSEEMANKDSASSSMKSLKEPFTVLILGVDSEVDGLNANAAFNGDTLILATINPKTLSATLFSIPRDTYVPIACRKGSQYKINSSAAYGTNCVIDTIEDLTSIEIDYYVKINFKGVVDLVDAVDGVEVDVEEPNYNYNHGVDCHGKVCESNSDRMYDADNMVYINPGLQTLNGEQALAYSRCRHLYIQSDLARNKHQQEVIIALGKKMMTIRSYSKFKDILDSVMNNVSTNMSTSQILSGYNMFKNMLKNALSDDEFINIQKTYLETYPLPVIHNGMTVSALGYYQDSLDEIVETMNINLEKAKVKQVKTFSFSITDNYTGKIAGKGKTSGSTNKSLASQIGNGKEKAQEYCNSMKLSCTFTYVDDTSSYYNNAYGPDVIGGQNPAPNTLLADVSSVTFYLNGATVKELENND